MHKWRGGAPKTAMHYALCNFGYECTGRTSFPPKPNAFSKLCIITICIITISTVALLTRAHTASEATLGQNTSTANWVRPSGASDGRLGLVVWLFSKEEIAVYPPQTSILKALRRSCHEQRNLAVRVVLVKGLSHRNITTPFGSETGYLEVYGSIRGHPCSTGHVGRRESTSIITGLTKNTDYIQLGSQCSAADYSPPPPSTEQNPQEQSFFMVKVNINFSTKPMISSTTPLQM
jgi:hypothetical protein